MNDCKKPQKRGDTSTPMYRLLGILAGPWTLYIMWVLLNSGPTRFGELKRLIEGISSKMLTERLRLLENEGFIYRHYEPTVPPQVTYGPTDRVTEILPALRQLCELASKWYSPSDFIHPQEPLQDSEKIQTKMTV